MPFLQCGLSFQGSRPGAGNLGDWLTRSQQPQRSGREGDLAMGAESALTGNLMFTFWIWGGFLLLLFLRRKDSQ